MPPDYPFMANIAHHKIERCQISGRLSGQWLTKKVAVADGNAASDL